MFRLWKPRWPKLSTPPSSVYCAAWGCCGCHSCWCSVRETLRYFHSQRKLQLTRKKIKGNNIAVVQRSLSSWTSWRIPRMDFTRDVCEMFHYVQHDKQRFWTTSILLPNKIKQIWHFAHLFVSLQKRTKIGITTLLITQNIYHRSTFMRNRFLTLCLAVFCLGTSVALKAENDKPFVIPELRQWQGADGMATINAKKNVRKLE